MNSITTLSGKVFNPFNFTEKDIVLEDLITGGCYTVRWRGQLPLSLRYPFNIIQHSCIVSDYCYERAHENVRNKIALAGLCHDLVESISPIGDISSRCKNQVGVVAFGELMTARQYESKATEIIFDALNIGDCYPYLLRKDGLVKAGDRRSCETESILLRNRRLSENKPLFEEMNVWSPEYSYQQFMNRWMVLKYEKAS